MPGSAFGILRNIFIPLILVDVFNLHEVHNTEAAAPDHIVHRGELAVLLQKFRIEELLKGYLVQNLCQLLVFSENSQIIFKGFI